MKNRILIVNGVAYIKAVHAIGKNLVQVSRPPKRQNKPRPEAVPQQPKKRPSLAEFINSNPEYRRVFETTY